MGIIAQLSFKDLFIQKKKENHELLNGAWVVSHSFPIFRLVFFSKTEAEIYAPTSIINVQMEWQNDKKIVGGRFWERIA